MLCVTKVVYICSSSLLLALESRDLSQAETKITVAKAEQILKITTIFTQNDNFWLFIIVILWIA